MMLDQILAHKRVEITHLKQQQPLAELVALARLAPRPRDLQGALTRNESSGLKLLAELKKASPSAGLIRPDFVPAELASAYQAGGAAALSVLTDTDFFQGKLEYLSQVRQLIDLPLLRKDFLLDPYQLYQTRAAGADGVLLIVAALGDARLAELLALAEELELAALVEVHNQQEVERALKAGARILGVNNRDLQTFQVDLATAARLRPLIPAGVVTVAESGIKTPADVQYLASLDYDAILVGEALMRQPDVAAAAKWLMGIEPLSQPSP